MWPRRGRTWPLRCVEGGRGTEDEDALRVSQGAAARVQRGPRVSATVLCSHAMDAPTHIRVTFWLLARPLFRAADWRASYAGSVLESDAGLAADRFAGELAELDEQRRHHQRRLGALGETHGDACAECRGMCCTEERFRDAFFDRVLQDPHSENRAPRSLRAASRETHAGPYPLRGSVALGDRSPGYCPNCTPQGCALAYEDRPIQCTAYYCWASIRALSDTECREGIAALRGLTRIMGRVTTLAAAARFSR